MPTHTTFRKKIWNSNGTYLFLPSAENIHSLFEVMNSESKLINIDSTKSQTKLIFQFYIPSAQYNDTLQRGRVSSRNFLLIRTRCGFNTDIIGGKV